MPGIIFLLALLVIIFIVLLSSIKVVNTGYLYVVERLGQFHKILEPGWHFIIPVKLFMTRLQHKSYNLTYLVILKNLNVLLKSVHI